jgi:hypothetical protein
MFTKPEKLQFPLETFTKDRGLGWPGRGSFILPFSPVAVHFSSNSEGGKQ